MNARTDSKTLLDARGRPLTDLRVSVTDRCNFRCAYCLPRDKVESGAFLPKEEILSFEEIERFSIAAVRLGVRKIRLTGGEPLIRKELSTLVRRLKALGVEIALTTNGVLLPKFASELKHAGLDRVTVSLDALDETIFSRMTDAPGFRPADVLSGIEAARGSGFSNLKVNVVVRRENAGEVGRIQRHFSGSDVVVRFIEFMDVGSRNGWQRREVVTKDEILGLVEEGFAARSRALGSPAKYYENAKTGQRIGVIASVTEPFCGDCSRLRLTADGRLFTCLCGSEVTRVKQLLREEENDEELVERVANLWSARADRYSEVRDESPRGRSLPLLGRIEMSTIGG